MLTKKKLNTGILLKVCDRAQLKGVKCPNKGSEKSSVKDEMFQKCDIHNMKCFRNLTFKTQNVFGNVTFKT